MANYTPYQHLKSENTAPSFDAAAVTPSDYAEIPPCRALYVGGAGDLNVVTAAGTTVKFVGVGAGSILPVVVTKVLSAGTTATSIVALY